MKITLVNHSDIVGGASMVSLRLLDALRAQGIDARMIVKQAKGAPRGAISAIGGGLATKAAFIGERLRIFLFGGGGNEQAVLERWAAKYSCVQSLAGKRYGFPAELALLNHLDVMLAMDSANMHLAAIAGAPTLSIWGATHPYCGFKGWRQRDDDTIQVPVPCRPCSVFGDKPCFRGDYICLTAIKPEVVYARMREKLK